jgi:hypothetical protein
MYKKMFRGGLLTTGIKEGYKKFLKLSGKKTKDFQKEAPLKSRSSGKEDMARGVQLHTKSPEDKKRLQKYIRNIR